MKSKIASIVIIIAGSTLLYLNWTAWHSTAIGVIGLLLYYGVSANVWGRIVTRLMPVRHGCTHLFGLLASFYLSAMAVGIPIVLWKYDHLTTALVLAGVGMIGTVIDCFANPPRGATSKTLEDETTQLNFTWRHILGGIAIGALFVYLLASARTGEFILSPWDALPPLAALAFFGLIYLAGRAVFSGRSTGFVLAIIIAVSYLVHLTLPLVYQTGYGGDRWRHLGAEQWLSEGKPYEPVVWGGERSRVSVGALAVPEALVAGNKTSYAPQWGITILLAESLAVSTDTIDLLLVYILYSLFMPLLLYHAGFLLFRREQAGLIAAFLPMLFASLQTAGAITLPVSLGAIWFSFVFLLWLAYINDGKRSTGVAATLLTLLSYWGYLLNFVVLLITAILAFTTRRARGSRVVLVVIGAVLAFALPALETLHGSSRSLIASVNDVIPALMRALELLAGLAGLTALPEGTNNFLFNQLGPTLANIPLLSSPLTAPILSLIVAGAIVWSITRKKKTPTQTLTAALFVVLLIGYGASWSGTDGVHILTRRLNETFAILLSLLAVPAILRIATTPIRTISVCAITALIATAAYASGPISQMVTTDELRAARFVWQKLDDAPAPYCVIGNTWPLLPLEAVSGRNIIAGGFPVYADYGQTERANVFKQLSENPTPALIDEAAAITGAESCIYMTEERWMAPGALAKTKALWGEPERVGDVYIWRTVSKKSTSSKATRSQR